MLSRTDDTRTNKHCDASKIGDGNNTLLYLLAVGSTVTGNQFIHRLPVYHRMLKYCNVKCSMIRNGLKMHSRSFYVIHVLTCALFTLCLTGRASKNPTATTVRYKAGSDHPGVNTYV